MSRLQSRDLIEGSLRYQNGYRWATRTAIVTGVSGPGHSKHFRAAETPGTPQQGERHPGERALRCYMVEVDPVKQGSAPDTFTVKGMYTDDPNVLAAAESGTSDTRQLSLTDEKEISFRPIAIQDTVIRDRFGRLMTTRYSYVNTSGTAPVTGALSSSISRFTHEVVIDRPGYIIDITQTMREDPGELNERYAGKLNSTRWGPYAPQVVRCEGFAASGNGNGLWRITGSFAPSPAARGDWRAEVYTVLDAEIPDDVKLGNGIALYEVYDLENLGNAGFDWRTENSRR